MKSYRRLWTIFLAAAVILFTAANLLIFHGIGEYSHEYQLEISRASQEIEQNSWEKLNLKKYPHLIAVIPEPDSQSREFWEGEENPCLLRKIGSKWYRFDYKEQQNGREKIFLLVNGCLAAGFLFTGGIMTEIQKKIITPFRQMENLPVSLAKGNLTVPIRAQEQPYFGKFLWGMDMLREQLESHKKSELKLQKEKKSLVLSLTHDIKTPLSAIKLSGQALSRGLYPEKEKQLQVAWQICQSAEQIEDYVKRITEASNEDFLHLEVRKGEFYLSAVIREIEIYYGEKLRLMKLPFAVRPYVDCLLRGDPERAVEVLQNLMENAIKYGQGGGITISFQEEGECSLITVENANCSLPSQELPHIFDSFWRGSNGKSADGSGLGLYICRQLMDKMGGEIFARQQEGCMLITVVFSKA